MAAANFGLETLHNCSHFLKAIEFTRGQMTTAKEFRDCFHPDIKEVLSPMVKDYNDFIRDPLKWLADLDDGWRMSFIERILGFYVEHLISNNR
jgi:hypothetical protein